MQTQNPRKEQSCIMSARLAWCRLKLNLLQRLHTSKVQHFFFCILRRDTLYLSFCWPQMHSVNRESQRSAEHCCTTEKLASILEDFSDEHLLPTRVCPLFRSTSWQSKISTMSTRSLCLSSLPLRIRLDKQKFREKEHMRDKNGTKRFPIGFSTTAPVTVLVGLQPAGQRPWYEQPKSESKNIPPGSIRHHMILDEKEVVPTKTKIGI